MTTPENYFTLAEYDHVALFQGVEHVWDVLHKLPHYVREHLRPETLGHVDVGAFVSDHVWLGPGAYVESGAMIKGPAIIGAGTVVRHGAYIRENCLIGRDCVVGHATELKNAIMLDGSHAPHFNYVGDSILGRGVNLGAGTRLANFKNDGSTISIAIGDERFSTGLTKFGAIIGDHVHTGCNVVTSPGTLIGPGCRIYAAAVLRGVYPPNTLVKVRQVLEAIPLE